MKGFNRLRALVVLAWAVLAQPVVADEVSVKVAGVDGEQRTNIEAFLSIRTKTEVSETGLLERLKKGKEAPSPADPPSSREIKRWHALAESEVQQALQPFGYYNVAVEAELEERSAGKWRATYLVTPGVRSRWCEVAVSAEAAEGSETLIAGLQKSSVPEQGSVVDHQAYATHKRRWVTQLFEAGFLDARFSTSLFTVDQQRNCVALNWVFDSGPRYLFGSIDIEQSILKDSLVSRYHNIKRGSPFSTDALIDLQLNLNNSNYFETVSLDIDRDSATDLQVPVVVRTTPRKRRRYNAGIGFGTDTGPRVTAGIESRRVNKRGHRYRVNSRASTIESSLQFEYDIPIKDVAKDRWTFYSVVERSDIGDAETTQYSLGAAREDDWGLFRRRVFLNAEQSSFEFGDEPSRNATLVYPGLTLSIDRLDNPQFVRRGFSVSGTVLGGADALGSSTDFASLSLSGRAILPLGRRGRLLGAIDARAVEAAEFRALPPSQRFFLGGDRSVRGYAFQSISPENSAGDDIGGSRSLNFSLEVDYQLGGSWGIAAFADAGDVSNSFPSDFSKGAGLGVRYRSPVGMIRVDLAHPFDDPDTNLRVHLSIGPDL